MLGRMTAYHRLLDEHIGDRSVSEVARAWGVPHWVLFDGIYENAARPSVVYAPRIARGMGIGLEEFLETVAPQEVLG